MHQSRQSIRTPLDYNNQFDSQFESQLPPEVRVELGASPRSINRPPVRIPETEAEIEQAVQWLKSQGYLRSTIPAPPPVSPPEPVVLPQAAKPTQSASRPGAGPWLWLLAMLLAIPVLSALLPHSQLQPWVEVRRALPVVPRALAVTAPSVGRWHSIQFSDGSTMRICDGGQLSSTALLPGQGRFVGDAFVIDNHYWIWMQPTNGVASWVDP
jgi:hypothetical protein